MMCFDVTYVFYCTYNIHNYRVYLKFVKFLFLISSPFVIKSKKEWEKAILTGYMLFRKLKKNNGGKVHFDILQSSYHFRNINLFKLFHDYWNCCDIVEHNITKLLNWESKSSTLNRSFLQKRT